MCNQCQRQTDADRAMWLAIRRGILAIARAIEARYVSNDERRAA